MKWIPYIAIWVYGLLVTGYGLGSMYNPQNKQAIDSGHIPTDIFAIVGIIILYFAYASSKQYFHPEAREKKRFDLVLIAVLTLVVTTVPIIYVALLLQSSADTQNYSILEHTTSLGPYLAFLVVLIASYFYSIRVFLFNK